MPRRHASEIFLAVQRRLIRGVQVVLLNVTLFLLYYIGFGLSRGFMSIFARRTLENRPREPLGEDTWWRPAEGYDLEESRLRRQS